MTPGWKGYKDSWMGGYTGINSWAGGCTGSWENAQDLTAGWGRVDINDSWLGGIQTAGWGYTAGLRGYKESWVGGYTGINDSFREQCTDTWGRRTDTWVSGVQRQLGGRALDWQVCL